MATNTQPSVPPSLEQAWRRLIRSTDPITTPQWVSSLQGTVFAAHSIQRRPTQLQLARSAGEWLADRHIPRAARRTRNTFIYDRSREILSAQFPFQFWRPPLNHRARTQRGALTCTLDPAGVQPPYADPERLASWCQAFNISADYPVPAALSPLPEPSAGWYGSVVDGIYEDRWVAQRMDEYDTEESVGEETTTPVWARFDVELALSASTRGNTWWGSTNLGATITNARSPHLVHQYRYRGTLSRAHAYRFGIAPPATPWSDTIRYVTVVDCHALNESPLAQGSHYVQLWSTPFAPHGRYFSRNDWAQAWLTSGSQLFVARADE